MSDLEAALAVWRALSEYERMCVIEGIAARTTELAHVGATNLHRALDVLRFAGVPAEPKT